MRIAFDVDGTLCNNTNGKYDEAEPYTDMVVLVNDLYDDGNYIIIHTARGMSLGSQAKAMTKWYSFTENQLKSWGVKYHELHLGKIEADVYIDDRAMKVNSDGSSASDLRRQLGSDTCNLKKNSV